MPRQVQIIRDRDGTPPPDSPLTGDDHDLVDRVVCALKRSAPKEYEIIVMSYRDGVRDKVIGKRLRQSRQWVTDQRRRIERKLEDQIPCEKIL